MFDLFELSRAAALMMGTSYLSIIMQNATSKDLYKLMAIYKYISRTRPNNYPKNPYVALISGLIAGRGITFQNPTIGFVCTSFCFTDTRDIIQRGANNTQRLGRACGMLKKAYTTKKPILICTKEILKDALANEKILIDKAKNMIEENNYFKLSLYVTKAEWKTALEVIGNPLNTKTHVPDGNKIDGVDLNRLKEWYSKKTLIMSKMIHYLYKQEKPISFQEFKDGIGYTASDKKFESNLSSGRAIGSRYGKIWSYLNNMIQMNPKIKSYLENL